MKISSRIVLLSAMFILTLSLAAPAQADVAPPANPPGSNPEPGTEITAVRMVSETVRILIEGDIAEDSRGLAYVTADFSMQNTGNQTETMDVRFPISSNDGFFRYPRITDFRVTVNDAPVETWEIQGEDPRWGDDTVPWAAFSVSFPPGERVFIQVRYTLAGTGYASDPLVEYEYLLSTGAGWHGTIGRGDIIVTLPYEASPQNLTFYGAEQTTVTYNGAEVRFHFEDIEPTHGDNLTIRVVYPLTWRQILWERQNIARNPNDDEAWGRLGRAYKESIRYGKGYLRDDPGGLELYELSVEAYEQALALDPDDAWWHAGFADLLLAKAFYMGGSSELLRALHELDSAIRLDPDNPVALELLENISYWMPEAVVRQGNTFVILYLTATPQPISTPLSTNTPRPSTPVQPMATPTSPSTPVPPSSPSLCGVSLMAPLGLVWLAWRLKKQNLPGTLDR